MGFTTTWTAEAPQPGDSADGGVRVKPFDGRRGAIPHDVISTYLEPVGVFCESESLREKNKKKKQKGHWETCLPAFQSLLHVNTKCQTRPRK